MIARVLLAAAALAALAALLYLEQGLHRGPGAAQILVPEPSDSFTATDAVMVQTGADGRPLFRVRGSRFEQPYAQGSIEVTDPRLDYQPPDGEQWTATAREGVLPADGRSADLSGAVHVVGRAPRSRGPLYLATERLHVDLRTQLATTSSRVQIDWLGDRVTAVGMRADLRSGTLQLMSKVYGEARLP